MRALCQELWILLIFLAVLMLRCLLLFTMKRLDLEMLAVVRMWCVQMTGIALMAFLIIPIIQ